MHVLVLDHDYMNVMAHAIQLSGYGLIVETVQDIEEAALRLSTMKFDAVLCNLDFSNDSHQARLLQFQESYPNTAFYTGERIGEFLGRIKVDNSC
jgi:CheY-like chemotaxis protein